MGDRGQRGGAFGDLVTNQPDVFYQLRFQRWFRVLAFSATRSEHTRAHTYTSAHTHM